MIRDRKYLLLAAGALVAIAFGTLIGPALITPVVPAEWQAKIVTIPRGMTTGQISSLLTTEGIIDHPWYFKAVSSARGLNKKLKAGRYKFNYPLSAWEAVGQLASGAVVYNSVTIPEGYTMAQIAAVLHASAGIDGQSLMAVCKDTVFLKASVIAERNCEGYLYPDTYEIEWNTPAAKVAERMAKRCLDLFTPEWKTRMAHDKRSLHQIMTMASLIESEAQVDSERVLVASVFYNRLRLRRPLESCASVDYILPRHKKTRLTFNDLKRSSPYNTYLHPGLPPGPVCNPGKKSIEAAIFPASTSYLYFVSRGDGGHVFSKTLEEHARAKYIINKMKDRQD
ncbi:MAG: endolytic transglycosylase MltG [Candidatus Edwardsbacteria bacterium]|nr:endolytic transglycosylase MltG [Candidatus Edwardsbacteria bacterium]